jgi:hypothetical protein
MVPVPLPLLPEPVPVVPGPVMSEPLPGMPALLGSVPMASPVELGVLLGAVTSVEPLAGVIGSRSFS